MLRVTGAVFLCVFLQCAAARAYPDLDWKLYDGMGSAGKGNVCFYEEHTIVRLHGSVIRVWTKCVAQRALDATGAAHLNARFSRAVIDMSASREEYDYTLPVLSAATLGKKQITAAIRYEAVADVGGLASTSMALNEIDCRIRRVRLISGTTGNRPLATSGWKTLPAKGPDARLARLLCP